MCKQTIENVNKMCIETSANVNKICNSIGLLCLKLDNLVNFQKDLIESQRGKKVPKLLNNKLKKN